MNHAKRRTHSKRRSKHGRNERVVEVPSRTSLSENTEELLSFWRGRLYGEQDTAPLTRIHRPGFPHRPPVIADRKSAVHRHHVSQLETRRHYDDSESTSDSRSSESASEDSPLSISGSPIMVCAMATVLFGFLIAAIALVLVRTDQESKMQTPFKPRPQAQSMCSVVLHSFCARIREEFYYLPSANSCVTALRDSTVLCNHSPNRFASLSSCTQRCVHPSKPAERCFHTAMFSQCVRERSQSCGCRALRRCRSARRSRTRSHQEHDGATFPSRDSVVGAGAPAASSAVRRDEASATRAHTLTPAPRYGGKLEHASLLRDPPSAVPLERRRALRDWLDSLHTSWLWYTMTVLMAAVLFASITAVFLDIQWAAELPEEDRRMSDWDAVRGAAGGYDAANTSRPKSPILPTSHGTKRPHSRRQRRKNEVSKAHSNKESMGTVSAEKAAIDAAGKKVSVSSVNTAVAQQNTGFASSPSSSWDTDEDDDDNAEKPLPPITEPSQSRCGEAMYRFCGVLYHLYHYRASTDTCVFTVTDHVRVCNRSPDRFATAEQCHRACALRNEYGEKPEVCSTGPLFAPCTW
ncbi:hypothetical protein V5799_012331 [Amblyomma americanum]|uniref:Uncharacterized protein n=1 Tax=Amblyomma americanum TaxID=6943 RepID=A0AAQ4EED8_AMBAM